MHEPGGAARNSGGSLIQHTSVAGGPSFSAPAAPSSEQQCIGAAGSSLNALDHPEATRSIDRLGMHGSLLE
jgi:hypothetical protein